MTTADWIPVIVTAVIQVIAVAYVYGKLSQKAVDTDRRLENFEKWQRDDVDPTLDDHGQRIAIVETTLLHTAAGSRPTPHDRR